MDKFIKRTVSGIFLGLTTILSVLYFPNWLFKLAISSISVLAVWEVASLLKRKLPRLAPVDIAIIGFIVAISYLFINIYFSFLVILLYAFYIGYKSYNLSNLLAVIFILVYGGILVSTIGVLFDINKYLLFVLFATVWAGDIFAYLTGKTIGRKKLAPNLSPSKTVEGAIGGATASIFFGVLVALLLGLKEAIIPIIISAFIMQIGDLFESFIKRQVKVKDSSNIIPGHGGILDRIDALIFASLVFLIFYTGKEPLVQILLNFNH